MYFTVESPQAGLENDGKTAARLTWYDRLFIIMTANIAVAFAFAGWYATEEYVHEVNAARSLDLHLLQLQAMAMPPSTKTTPDNSDEPSPMNELEKQQIRLQNQIGITGVIATIWNYVMYLVAIILELCAVVAILFKRAKWPQVVAAVFIILSTIGTLVGLSLLMDPNYGGLKPLAARMYLYVGAAQGSYGIVLLVTYVTIMLRNRYIRALNESA
jgi:hypothetical protein